MNLSIFKILISLIFCLVFNLGPNFSQGIATQKATTTGEVCGQIYATDIQANAFFLNNGEYLHSISSITSKPIFAYYKLRALFLTNIIEVEKFEFDFSHISNIHFTNFRILILYPFHVFW